VFLDKELTEPHAAAAGNCLELLGERVFELLDAQQAGFDKDVTEAASDRGMAAAAWGLGTRGSWWAGCHVSMFRPK
jgi:hypothetical protein